MFEVLPDDVRDGLAKARQKSLKRGDKLSVRDGDAVYRILRIWDGGFAISADVAPRLRGRVSIYDGARHVYQCLIIDSELSGDERIFDFKWVHHVPDGPPADFIRETDAPIALLGS